MIATWIAAVATAVYSAVFVVPAVYLVRQWREARLLREAAVIRDVYDYVIRTHEARASIYEHEEAIRRVSSTEQLWAFEAANPVVMRAIHDAANCYHYMGFLLRNGLLTSGEAVLFGIKGGSARAS